MIFEDYEPFLATLKIAGPVKSEAKVQDMVYILQNLGYPLDEDFSLRHGMYSEHLALKIQTMKQLGWVEDENSMLKSSTGGNTNFVNINKYERWHKCIQELNRKSPQELSLLAVYLYLQNCKYKEKETDFKMVELGYIDKKIGWIKRKGHLSDIKNNKKILEELCKLN